MTPQYTAHDEVDHINVQVYMYIVHVPVVTLHFGMFCE